MSAIDASLTAWTSESKVAKSNSGMVTLYTKSIPLPSLFLLPNECLAPPHASRLTIPSDASEKICFTGADLGSVTINAGVVKRFKSSSEIVSEPSNGVWWPTKSNHEAVDFYRQPNELCQVTVNVDHVKLNMTTILKEFEVSPGTFGMGQPAMHYRNVSTY